MQTLARKQKDTLAHARRAYLDGLAPEAEREALAQINARQAAMREAVAEFAGEIPAGAETRPNYEAGQYRHVSQLLARALATADEAPRNLTPTALPNALEQMWQIQVELELRRRSVRCRAAGPGFEPDRL